MEGDVPPASFLVLFEQDVPRSPVAVAFKGESSLSMATHAVHKAAPHLRYICQGDVMAG
jgi:hypothetical protein